MSVYLKSGYNFAQNLLYSLPMKKYFLLSLLLFTFGSLAAQSNRTFIRSHLKNIAAQSNENVTIEIAAKRKGLKVKLTGAISNNSDEIYAGFLILVVMSNTNLDPEQDQVAKDIEIAYKVIEVTFGDNGALALIDEEFIWTTDIPQKGNPSYVKGYILSAIPKEG